MPASPIPNHIRDHFLTHSPTCQNLLSKLHATPRATQYNPLYAYIVASCCVSTPKYKSKGLLANRSEQMTTHVLPAPHLITLPLNPINPSLFFFGLKAPTDLLISKAHLRRCAVVLRRTYIYPFTITSTLMPSLRLIREGRQRRRRRHEEEERKKEKDKYETLRNGRKTQCFENQVGKRTLLPRDACHTCLCRYRCRYYYIQYRTPQRNHLDENQGVWRLFRSDGPIGGCELLFPRLLR